MKVNPIYENVLYVRGRSDHLDGGDKAEAIVTRKITHVINLWSRADPDMLRMGVTYLHRPMPDGRTVPHWLLGLAEELAGCIRDQGARVLIQCHAGRNRSCLLAATVLWALTGMPGEACLEYVRTMRPDAVDNDDFEAWLDMLPGFDLKEGT